MKLHPFVDLTTISLILSILALTIVILVLRYKRQLRELEQETSIILKALDNGLSLNEAMTEKRNRDWQRTRLASRVYSAIGAVIILAAGLSAMIYLKETPILEVCLWFFFLGAVLLTVGIVTGVSCQKKKTDQ